ncbi:lytic murein transglycosylase [Chelatococcus sp. SYSU_G07232]|uniref:Lytic murein transglycosylase n=1 Tax=Chelatococcus albus TaxID=3047466 RepID=A0ABT7AEB7_9HYPH|nr:lytic murein transglycosylase [Chelatococcus sp. SYSU_G07232]MDJ1157688.1 lytic murein transglycosylase [Chelatococcus sp. SYSU_G07232]
MGRVSRIAFAFAIVLAAALVGASTSSAASSAASCRAESFDVWLDDFREEAAAQGISRRAISAALTGIAYDAEVVARDRAQGVFKQSFAQFAGRMISPYRVQKGASLLQRHAAVLDQVERRFGVPAPVVVAIWGLETDFGANRGNVPTLTALASLAYDCRRSAMFTNELLDALRVVDRGDLSPAEMRGAWHGELGQTQFLPSSYVRFAVDFDGDGRADLIRSAPDVFASTANYLKGYGWRRGEAWDEGTANFEVIRQWNRSAVYARTVAAFAARLADGRTAERDGKRRLP